MHKHRPTADVRVPSTQSSNGRRRLPALLLLLSLLLLSTVPRLPAAGPTAVSLPQTLRFRGQLGGIHALAVQNGRAYAAAGQRLVILDLASPNYPRAVGQTAVLPAPIADVAVNGSTALVAVGPADPMQGSLRLVDVADPARPLEIAAYRPAVPFVTVHGVAVSGSTAFLATSAGLRVLDVSNPAAPQEIGVYGAAAGFTAVVAAGQRAYAVTGSAVLLLDVANPAAPQLVGQFAANANARLAVAGSLAYVADGYAGLKIVDVSNPAAPAQLGVYDRPAYDVAVMGSRAYVGGGFEVYVLDVANPAAPALLGRNADTGQVDRLVVAGDSAFVAANGRFQTLHLADWPYALADFGAGQAADLAIAGSTAYLSGSSGLHVVDLADPDAPTTLGRFPAAAGSVAVAGHYAYLVAGGSGLTVVDVSRPQAPVEVGANHNVASWGAELAAANGHVYIADGSSGLQIVSVTNPANPLKRGAFQTNGSATGVAVSGSTAYVTATGNRLHVVNVANPAAPVQLGAYTTPQTPSAVAVAGHHAYVAVGSAGLRIVDVGNPAAPQEAGLYTAMFVNDVFVSGTSAYLIGAHDVLLLDVSNPTAPVEVATYRLPEYAYAVAGSGDFVYVATDGLAVLQHAPAATATISTGGGSLTSAAGDVTYTFPAGGFANQVKVSHTPLAVVDAPAPAQFVHAGPIFETTAVSTNNGQPAQPVAPYTLAVTYADAALHAAAEDTLTLFYWDGAQWQPEASSVLDTAANTVTATPDHLALWTLGGTADYRVYLPAVLQRFTRADLAISRLEITQAVQNSANSVPLVAGRDTVLRVHAATTGLRPLPGITLTLSATRSGAPLPGSPLVVGPWAIYPGASPVRLGESINVPLPAAWTSGQVTFSAVLDAANAVAEPDEGNNAATATVAFQAVPPLDVRLVPVAYTDTYNGITCPAPTTDEIGDWLRRAYPVSAVNVTLRAPINYTGYLNNFGFNQLLDQVTQLKLTDGAPDSQVYYGLIGTYDASGSECGTDVGGLGWVGQRTAIGVSSSQPNQPPIMDDSGLIAVHEIGHNFGLWHAPCGGPMGTDPAYPYADGSTGQYGFDVFRYQVWSPKAPDYAKDVMSYCGPKWFSDYNYRQLFDNQVANGRTPAQSAPAAQLLIRAALLPDDTAVLHPIYAVTGPAWAVPAASDYAIELRDASGQVLATQPAAVFTAAEGDAAARAIYATVPLPAAPVAQVRLLHAGTAVAVRDLAPPAAAQPAALTLQPDGDGLIVRWGTPGPALLRYTTDDGQSWTTLGIDVTDGEMRLSWADLPGENGRFELRLAAGSR
ncbi:MAG: hypothetical protein KC425_24680 [Anaerolineales bacterium]|nr:hypothetical protein [Anaerolineales bacterium]